MQASSYLLSVTRQTAQLSILITSKKRNTANTTLIYDVRHVHKILTAIVTKKIVHAVVDWPAQSTLRQVKYIEPIRRALSSQCQCLDRHYLSRERAHAVRIRRFLEENLRS